MSTLNNKLPGQVSLFSNKNQMYRNLFFICQVSCSSTVLLTNSRFPHVIHNAKYLTDSAGYEIVIGI